VNSLRYVPQTRAPVHMAAARREQTLAAPAHQGKPLTSCLHFAYTRSCADHTMFRIKDAKVSLKFYTEILGMELGESDTESIDVGTEPYC
jgi:predicted metalloenzyme YecM